MSFSTQKPVSSSSLRRRSPHGTSSGDSSGPAKVKAARTRDSFTRSRSPALSRTLGNLRHSLKPQNHMSPLGSRIPRQKMAFSSISMLPANIEFRVYLPFTSWAWDFSIDIRILGESLLLLMSLLYASFQLSTIHTAIPSGAVNNWISIELEHLRFVSLLYIIWTHSTISKAPINSSPKAPVLSHTSAHNSSQSSHPSSGKDSRRNSPPSIRKKNDFGFIWMSVPKNYRESRDDGIFTGLLLGPLIASVLLVSSLREVNSFTETSVLPAGFLVEGPTQLRNPKVSFTPAEAILLSRYSLVNLGTFCAVILLLHVSASWWVEALSYKSTGMPEGERASVPRSEGRRSWYYVTFAVAVTIGVVGLKLLFGSQGYGVWQHLNYFEATVAALFYQFALYVGLRLAHHSFTLGELGLVCFGGTAICLEFLNLTIARIWPVTTPFIRTYRLPTPLLIFQIALIVGSFLTGFLLSPFLVLSRSNARRPVHRLRFPEEKQRNRRYYALGFYIGTVLIVAGPIGLWTRWCLGYRDPWIWVVFWLLEGNKKWSRPALLGYWALLCSLSVAGWTRQLARSRKYRPRNPADLYLAPEPVDPPLPSPLSAQSSSPSPSEAPPSAPPTARGMTFANLPALPTSADVSNAATEFLDAADKHVPTLGLNARRKFFHGLAVVMFIPGIAVDPAFTHLSFSLAFAMFTFAEYVRYFAIFPFGAAVHVFMNEFMDHKDTGTAILSHFYLLAGCAGTVWLEGHSRLLQFTGTLALGVGDAMASIVGRRIGTHKWSPTTSKTLEGSLAFVVSVVAGMWCLRVCGFVEPFPTSRYIGVVAASSLLEALSDQNDNLTLPLYMWCMSSLAGL